MSSPESLKGLYIKFHSEVGGKADGALPPWGVLPFLGGHFVQGVVWLNKEVLPIY